ncbi:MAG: hypothetical protein RMZ41_021045 [Nostoc sp. DedVER02]|uniref:hypothetical protein n=1 Tax=unclassified Nostoc TaxID=2593658 RepID=UPI002AD56954|nr:MULTISPECIES: hypothetical protein [unclassified Nostoc]MDZ7986445.1 hypothetical protein [Nostoc sp. DedVER02]MDZ8114055.1 hypothetical protein [Nostoc sp. DedVER01b]
MQKYFSHFLMLALGTASALIVTPCQAQTPVKPNSHNTDNISSVSSNLSSTIPLNDSANSTNNKPTIVSEVSNNSSANTNIAATKPKLRLPIFSRIFPTPSMRQ